MKITSFLFLFATIFFSSCSKNQDQLQSEFEQEVINSLEFKQFMTANAEIKNIDDIIFEKSKFAENNGASNKKELSSFFINTINPAYEKQCLVYLEKIGVKNYIELFNKRKTLFTTTIPNALDAITEKHPNFKKQTYEDFLRLQELYNKQYLTLRDLER